MEKELQDRISELRAKLDDKYMPSDIREDIIIDLDILIKLQHALYFY
jgi:hypothetical protein